MIDKMYRLSRDQINALSKKEAIEFYNAWANYWRYGIGINVMPGAWRIVGKEKRFIPIIPWKEYQDKPIPEVLHQEWIANGSFVTGIAGIFGLVWHRLDNKGYYFGQIDADNAIAIKEIITWKGDTDIAAFAKRTLVEQHEDNLQNSMHVGLYSKTPLTNKDADVPKSDKDRPSFEVHCIGRMGIMSPSKHKRGYPMMLPSLDATTEPMTLDDGSFEQYLNSICIKHGLRPYLGNDNGHNRNVSSNNRQQPQNKTVEEHETGTPLSPEIVEMIRTKDLNTELEIHNGTRHKTLLKIADYILFRYSETESLTSLKDFFILVNEHYCKPTPLPIAERDQIWADSVEYVSRKKAEQSNRMLSVSEAIREKPGPGKIVGGIIASVSTPFKAITHSVWRCLHCNASVGELMSRVPVVNIASLKAPSKCENCEERMLSLDDELSIFEDAKIISLQNQDLVNSDPDEQLEVMIYGDYTKNIRAGELVTVHGRTHITQSNNGSRNGKKLFTILHAKFVVYEDRRTFDIIDKDIAAFHRFVNIKSKAGLSDEQKKHDVIDRLVSMFAPNVIGENDKKLGCLRSAVGGVEENRRGRIHTLFAGDKGLAKSLTMRQATKTVPNSRYITAKSASSKSALGIVDSNNDTKTLVYGPIPLSSGAMVGIDELQTWTFEEQGILLNVMEEGEFYLLKYGKNYPIPAHTTILATMNQQDIDYANRSTIAKEEISILQPLLDRFDQVYVSLDNRSEEEDRKYSDRRVEDITKRMSHNYSFLTKYLLYARRLQPIFTAEAKSMLKEFWLQLRKEKLAGNRTLESILRIAEATAKLHLTPTIDASIATEAMESMRLMFLQHAKFVNTIEDPRIIAVEGMVELVHKTAGPIAFEELRSQVCNQLPQVNGWFFGGHNRRINTADNRRYRELHDRFVQRIKQPNSKIIITSIRPLVVMWQTAKVSEVSTSEQQQQQQESVIDMIDMFDKNQQADISKTVAENGDKGNHVAQNSPNIPLGHVRVTDTQRSPNQNTDFLVMKNENMSNMSNMSNRPTYTPVEPLGHYRCDWCKCIYYADTKDSNAAHPCNFKGNESV